MNMGAFQLQLIRTMPVLLMLGTACHLPQVPPSTAPAERLTVGHHMVPCAGVGVQLCLLVSRHGREAEYFYDPIEGFDYEWGYSYEITVETEVRDNPPADAASTRYRLTEVVTKSRIAPETTFELALQFAGRSLVEIEDDRCTYLGAAEILSENLSCAALQEAGTGVFRHRGDRLELVAARD